jgi:hypothetical protein
MIIVFYWDIMNPETSFIVNNKGRNMEYNAELDIAILEFFWAKVGSEVVLEDALEEIASNGTSSKYEEFEIRQHFGPLFKEELIEPLPPYRKNDFDKSIVAITPQGLSALRTARLMKEQSSLLERMLYTNQIS